ncbi:MAG: FtsX-like permease family protein [Ilumatobacteraceae bacterium]
MFRIALKSALARKGRLLLTALAIIAGCAFLSGVFVFSDTIRGSFDRLFANAYEKTDAFVRSSNVIEGDFGAESRDRLPDTLIEQIRAVPGVAEAEGDIQGFARIATADGTVIGQNGPPKYGGVYIASASSPWSLAEGRVASGPTEVVIDRRSAKEGTIEVGDTIDVTGKVGVRPFTVVGIATFAGSDTSGGATWALFDLPTAQEFVLGQPGQVDSIAVVGDGSMTPTELTQQIADQFSDQEVEALTGTEITEENQSAVERGLSFFTLFLTIFAAISLFVGSFIIYNVFSISAAQRQRENALLRAIGASRAQVTRVLFTEALAVGVLGGVLGFAAGVALATVIIKILTAIGFGPSDSQLIVKPMTFVVTLIVGVVVTMVCAIVPAIRSGRVPPLAAMRDVAVDRSALSRGRLVTGFVFVAIAALGIALGLTVKSVWLGPGIVGLFVALVVLGPLMAAPIARALTRPLAALRGVTGEMAGRNAATSPKRTALTASALAIGLALLIGVSTLGSSVKSSIRASVGEGFSGDFAISTSDSNGFGGLPTTLVDELNALPQVADAVGIGVNLVNVVEQGRPAGKTVLTVEPDRAANLFDLPFTDGGWQGLDATSILMSTDKAERDGLAVGDTVVVQLQDKTSKDLRLAGLFDSEDFGNLIVARDLFAGQDTDLFDVQVLVQSTAGTTPVDAEEAIRTVTDRYPTSKVQTRVEFIDDQTKQVDGFLNFIYALLAMSIFIAILGIVITLLLAVYERRRELGLVRAIGMTRPQVRGSIRWEAFITALLGAIIGTALGITLGWVVVKAFSDDLRVFSVSIISIVVFVIASVAVSVVAAWVPARKAAKADILQAIATT